MWRLGPRSLLFNLLHRIRLRIGWYSLFQRQLALEALPEDVTSAAKSPFRAPAVDSFRAPAGYVEQMASEQHEISSGRLLYFSHNWLARPQSWRTHPKTHVTSPLDHWSKIGHFDDERGDIKWFWEASRFDWAYTLGRNWCQTGNEAAAIAFWALLEDWATDNPPCMGVNWVCGQECSLRLIALVWAAGVFADAKATTPKRMRVLWSVVACLARRIRSAFVYALSQNNNHGLSEAVALYLAGTCLPTLPEGPQWMGLGRRWCEKLILEQFAEDGLYIQKSFNYTRLALRVASVYVSTAAKNGDEISADVRTRLFAALCLLDAVTDEQTGRVPNFGANDGANIHQMSSASYLDFRPVVQFMSYQLVGEVRYRGHPALDEELVWAKAGPGSLHSIARKTMTAPPISEGRYAVLHGARSRMAIHCEKHRTRPGHADMLHVDAWYGSVNVARDTGTYSYADAGRWGQVLAGSAGHNVVLVDGMDQMRRLTRFLWGNWTDARTLISREWDSAGTPAREWSGEHYGFRRQGVIHRRTVHGRGDDWLIIDDMQFVKPQSHELTLLWHLDPGVMWVASPSGCSSPEIDVLVYSALECIIERASGADDMPGNAESHFYDEIHPGLLMSATLRADTSTRIVTSIGRQHALEEDGHWRWCDLLVPMRI
jgi:hypothetical protein